MLKPVDLHKELLKVRRKEIKKETVLSWVDSVLKDVTTKHHQIYTELKNSIDEEQNNFDFDKLETDRIFHIAQIRKICINYRLKFLNTSQFKGEYPIETISKIRQLEKEHGIELKGYKITAPSILFKLKKADDPLLFAPMGNGFYYLIDKWGNDMSFFRKIKYWPAKNVENLLITLFLTSLFLASLTHQFFFREATSITYFIVLFMFYAKGAIGLAIFYGIAIGKNFSEYAWKSKYDKVC
ncbi:hypothetical protein [Tenacibaculum amylolyticum]|uniref:hypothetical protein n=1 Tax=Tenacibaculum amylolyticum TaxID=104269 RepID=UPI003895BED2